MIHNDVMNLEGNKNHETGIAENVEALKHLFSQVQNKYLNIEQY
jgi:hypothetical protein